MRHAAWTAVTAVTVGGRPHSVFVHRNSIVKRQEAGVLFAWLSGLVAPVLLLVQAVGMDTWHHEHNPEGSTVEMHGNIRSAHHAQYAASCSSLPGVFAA
jgi:hypothetical protein